MTTYTQQVQIWIHFQTTQQTQTHGLFLQNWKRLKSFNCMRYSFRENEKLSTFQKDFGHNLFVFQKAVNTIFLKWF